MRRRSLLVLLFVFLLPLAGCRTWQPVDVSAEALFAAEPPPRVRVTRSDGELLTLEAPEIRAGAIVATAAPGAVLLDDVSVLEVRRTHVLRSIAFVLPGAILLAIVGKESCRC